MEKRTLHRAGAICAGLGAIVTGVSYGVHPELAEAAAFLPIVAGSSRFADIHWGLIIGMVLMQFGFAAVTLTLREQPERNDAGGWAQLGLYTLLVGLTLWIGVFVTEVALKPLADGLRTDPALTGGARALSSLVDAGGTAATFVYWLGVALLGTALLISRRYPRWMGAIGLVLGAVISLGIGLPRAFLGQSAWTEKIGFPILAFATLVWTLVLGVMLWRLEGAGQGRR
jgi:hypothetical protein